MIADIDADIAAGNLTSWDDAPDLIEPYPRGDAMLEGQEIERAPQPGEDAYAESDNSDLSEGNDEGSDDDGKGGGGGGGAAKGAAGPSGSEPGGGEGAARPDGSEPGGGQPAGATGASG